MRSLQYMDSNSRLAGGNRLGPLCQAPARVGLAPGRGRARGSGGGREPGGGADGKVDCGDFGSKQAYYRL